MSRPSGRLREAEQKAQAKPPPPIDLLEKLANPEKPYLKKSPRLQIVNGGTERPQPKALKASKAEAEIALEEQEALKAEAPVTAADLNGDEVKRRKTMRWLKLKEINSRYGVIRSYGGKCVVVTEGRSPINPNKKVYVFQSKEAFEQWMANEFVPSLKKKDERDAVGSWWWRHPKRRQYDAVVFEPLEPPIVRTADGPSLFNTYLGWGVEPKQGDWSLMRRHIKEVLANSDPKTDDYITRWTAWSIQHPDKLPLVALVLIGCKGRGKGTFARALEIIFGSHSLQISSQRHVVGNFNAHLENLILMISDEAYWAGHKADAGSLQRMITEPSLTIEAKGYDVRNVKNRIHLLMLAEPGWAVPAGQDERRYAVYEVSEEARDEAYFKALYREIDGGGPAAMLYDLQHMDLGDWHPRHIYKTAALRHQQELSLSPWDEWMLGLLEEGELPGTVAGRLRTASPTALLYDAKEKVLRLRDQGKMKLADYLGKQWQCTKYHDGPVRGYNFPPLANLRSTWDKRFGHREWTIRRNDWGQPVIGNEK